MPTLREFTELSDESRDAFEEELGETPDDAARRDVARQSREEADDDSAPALAPDDGHVRAIPGEVQELDDEEPHAVSDDEPTLTSEAPSHDD